MGFFEAVEISRSVGVENSLHTRDEVEAIWGVRDLNADNALQAWNGT